MHALPVPRRSGSRRASDATLFRIALAVLLVTSLAGCGVTMQTGIDMVRSAVGGSDDLEAVAAQAAASPYASLMVDDGRVRGVMVLGNDDQGRLSWHSGSQLLFLCEGGLVCGTHGLGGQLDDMRVKGPNPFVDLPRLGDGAATVARQYDWPDGHRYGIPVTGTLQRTGQESVELPGRSRSLVRYDEQLRGPGVEGRNSYWVDPATGTLWKSRQLVEPGVYIDIVQLKPYRRGPR